MGMLDKPADTLMDAGRRDAFPNNSGPPAARYDGSVFFKVAKDVGLPTDHGTLNKIVRAVNRGYTPEVAAQMVKNGTSGE